MPNKENAVQLYNAVTPAIKLNPSDMCDKETFLSKINEHVLQHQNDQEEDYVNNMLLHNTIKKASEFFDTLSTIQTTIKSLKKSPLLLSAFFVGLKQTCPEYYPCVSIIGIQKPEQVNIALNQYVL